MSDIEVQSPDIEIVEPHDLQHMPLKEWFELRQQARLDLHFLCRDVLGFVDVDPESVKPHRSMLSYMQHFQGGTEAAGTNADNLTLARLKKGYKPKIKMWDLANPSPQRKTMILCSREFLKSSICTVAHSIQWVINYPNVRVLLSSGTGDQVNKFMSGILQHFRFNDVFRWLFPEHVPQVTRGQSSIERFGSTAGMTTQARTVILNEQTFTTTSIGSAVAGGHYDVVKHDDVVNEVNVRTPESILAVNEHLRMTAPLLQRRHGKPGWTDYIGTRYDYNDAYGQVLDGEKKLPPEKRTYSIVFEPAWTGAWGTDSAKATWAERLPITQLQAIENDPLQGPNVLASQYGLIPRPASSGLIKDRKEIIWTPRKVINELYASLRLHVTGDLHGMAPVTAANKHADNDYTAITLAGFARDGHCYIISIYHGRPSPLEVIAYLFDLWQRHPRIIDMKFQKDHIFNTLAPFLYREQMKRQKFLPLIPMPVNNQISKKNKIRGLQPWFATQVISFAEDIGCRFMLEEEILRFPRFHDDIIETVRDQMENRDGKPEGDAGYQPPIPGMPKTLLGAAPTFTIFGPDGTPLWSGLSDELEPSSKDIDPFTGI